MMTKEQLIATLGEKNPLVETLANNKFANCDFDLKYQIGKFVDSVCKREEDSACIMNAERLIQAYKDYLERAHKTASKCQITDALFRKTTLSDNLNANKWNDDYHWLLSVIAKYLDIAVD